MAQGPAITVERPRADMGIAYRDHRIIRMEFLIYKTIGSVTETTLSTPSLISMLLPISFVLSPTTPTMVTWEPSERWG